MTLVEVYKLNLSLAIQVQVLLNPFFRFIISNTSINYNQSLGYSDRSNEVTQQKTVSPRRL
jgi:hypothetical protein